MAPYPGRLTPKVLLICIVASTGGLMSGYHTGILGGVSSMPSFSEMFAPATEEPNVGSTNLYCKFNCDRLLILTIFFSSAAVMAPFLVSGLTRESGPRHAMLLGGSLFLAGALVNGFAHNAFMPIIGHILLGHGIVSANQSAPLYLSEMAPCKYRGALNICFQLCSTIGIQVAYILNYFTARHKNGWRISFGLAAIPALIFTIGSFFLPDTPNSLIERRKQEEAKRILRDIRGVHDVDEEFSDLVAASVEAKKIKNHWFSLLKRKYRPQLVFVILIPFFQQLTGVNVFMLLSPVLFKTTWRRNDPPSIYPIAIGMVNSAATMFSMIVADDQHGRRFLFIQGGIQMFICQIIITICISSKFGVRGNPGDLTKWFTTLAFPTICTYIAGFAWSWGPLGWLVPSEILPLEIRSEGLSVNVCVNMLLTLFIAVSFTEMLCRLKFWLFIISSCLVLLMTIFIIKFLPETKGIPIEKMADVWKAHPFWKKFVIDEDENGEDVEISAYNQNKVLNCAKISRCLRFSRLFKGEDGPPRNSSSEANSDEVTIYTRSNICNWIFRK